MLLNYLVYSFSKITLNAKEAKKKVAKKIRKWLMGSEIITAKTSIYLCIKLNYILPNLKIWESSLNSTTLPLRGNTILLIFQYLSLIQQHWVITPHPLDTPTMYLLKHLAELFFIIKRERTA